MALVFTVERPVRASPGFVHHWWMENGPGLEQEVRDAVAHERLQRDAYHFRVRRTTRQAGRTVEVESEVEVADVARWSCRTTTVLDGLPFTEETVDSSLTAVEPGTWFRAAHSIRPIGPPVALRSFVLALSRSSLRRHREQAMDQAIATLERAASLTA